MVVLAFACDSDDDNTPQNVAIDLRFTQSFGDIDDTVDEADLNTTVYTNANGEQLTISRLRYLISNITFINEAGDTFEVEGYNLRDLSNPDTALMDTDLTLAQGTYTLQFTYGFNEEDNVDGGYPDLNEASWNWPMMLGGGYHFLQMDGLYNVETDIPAPFNFHNGTARPSEGVFEANHVNFSIPNVTLTSDTEFIIDMDIAEWFVNPNTWDLNELNTPLMPNYMAQIMMHENAATVFSVISN